MINDTPALNTAKLVSANDSAYAWSNVEVALVTHFYEPDLEAARAVFAGLAAHDLKGPLVWTMIVAPPGCGKTELINPFHGMPRVHQIDSITPNTLISGRAPEPGKTRGKEGLLERIGPDGYLFMPDFSTIIDGNRDRRDEIFAQLRRVYDGRLRKEFGIEGVVNEWSGRLTIMVAVTPGVDRYTSVFGALGDRFLLVRWQRVSGIDAAIMAMNQDREAKDAHMRAAVRALWSAMETAPEPQLSPEIARCIAATAELIAIGRTPVRRDRDEHIDHVPEAEGATRLAQQLCQLAKGSARLELRLHVDAAIDLAVVYRVAFDTLPPQRAAVLRAVLKGHSTVSSGLKRHARERAVADLKALDLLDDHGRLTTQTRGLFAAAGLLKT